MTTFDLTPLFRSSVGFEHMMTLIENLSHGDQQSYPPYNIEKIDESYIIKMAVAGFNEEQLSVSLQKNTLIITGTTCESDENVEYLHKGIAQRRFERHFQLADFIEIGGANLENGLLSINLIRKVPENITAQKIDIVTKSNRSRQNKKLTSKKQTVLEQN